MTDTKTCKFCGRCLPISQFSIQRRKTYIPYKETVKPSPWCKECTNLRMSVRHYDFREHAIQTLGGKCVRCGITGDTSIFDFHHADPSTKNQDVVKKMKKASVMTEEIEKELQKCILLCSNCHRLEHHQSMRSQFRETFDNVVQHTDDSLYQTTYNTWYNTQ